MAETYSEKIGGRHGPALGLTLFQTPSSPCPSHHRQISCVSDLLATRPDFQPQPQSPGHTPRRGHESLLAKRVDLGLIAAEVHGGCMGLPQEIVDHIMDMLQNDVIALKACSLTCKVMFVSARHLIHHTLYHEGGQLEDTHPRREGTIRTRGPARTRTPLLVFRRRTRSPQVRQTSRHPH